MVINKNKATIFFYNFLKGFYYNQKRKIYFYHTEKY